MSRNKFGILLIVFAISAILYFVARSGSVGGDAVLSVDAIGDAEISDGARTADWLAYGRTHSEQRFSPLNEINRQSVARLSPAWFLDLPNDVGLVATPLVVNGVLYFTGTLNVIRAVDAATGDVLWTYDPDVAGHIGQRRQLGWVHNRGISFYEGKIFAATWDGRLFALNAGTGELLWEVRTFADDAPLYITGAPKAFKGKVIVGNGGTEVGRARGFVTAFDADTGEEVWRFYTVPGDPAEGFENDAMAMAAATWTGNWWEHGGGGTVWHGITYDPEFDAVYIGTGNGAPWNRRIRSPDGGDNLFLASVVALDADSGGYRWHYQTTPGETWDYTSTMDIVLADIQINEKPVKAILHAPKNGFFYVIDRSDGKLVSAEAFTRVTWASHVDLETGRPVETADARYADGEAEVWPSPHGAHSWQSMSYNPTTGLVYLPTMHLGGRYVDSGLDASWRAEDFIGGTGVGVHEILLDEELPPGMLQAWDPVQQKAVWTVAQQHPWNAGTLATPELVFQGQADGQLSAYDAATGARAWQFDLGLGISAPPISYQVGGRQYIALLVGYGGGYTMGFTPGLPDEGWAYGVHRRRLVAFALDGDAQIPRQPPPVIPEPLVVEDYEIEEAVAVRGMGLYGTYCSICHGGQAIANAMAPDLRASPVPLDKDLFAAIVRDGARVNRAMPAFAAFDDADLEALRQYLRAIAHYHAGVYEAQ